MITQREGERKREGEREKERASLVKEKDFFLIGAVAIWARQLPQKSAFEKDGDW